MMCIVCEGRAELHHVKTRKSGGGDEPWNLCPLCRKHHTEIHAVGTLTFSKRHPEFLDWLKKNNWEMDLINNKWRHG
jgi:ABC-type proline/glycine betaine transport system substrate-binding protein